MGFLDKLKEVIENFAKSQPQFDPATLNDEVAMKTEWNPAKGGGTNICSHRLKEVSSRRVEFKASAMAFIFPSIFIVAGLGAGIGMTVVGLREDVTMIYFGVPFGTIFFLVGFFILRSWIKPRVFDLDTGYYWSGNVDPVRVNMDTVKEHCMLRDVYAIQLLRERCTSSSSNGRSSSYYSYELNLVLKDGKRINVVDHGNLLLLRDDAEKLSVFLDVPVWDAILTS